MAPLRDTRLPAPVNDPNTHETIQSFLQFLNKHSCEGITFDARSRPRTRRFFPERAVKTYFDCTRHDDAQRVRELVAAATQRSCQSPDYRTVASDCPRVFSILASIGQSQYIDHFVHQANLQDGALPFRREAAHLFPVIANNTTFFEAFYQKQWEFCVLPLKYRLDPVVFEDDRILPISLSERLDRRHGSSASVHKIVVHGDYDALDRGQAPQSIPHVYALKSYYPTAADDRDPNGDNDLPRPKDYYDAEVEAFRRLNDSGEPAPNLIGFYGAFTQSNSRHIILQYANVGTLEDYWKKVEPPKLGRDILTLWSKVFEVCNALVQIHEREGDRNTGRPQIFRGWHEDLRPANILVVGDIENSPYEVHFMVADLGLSHFSAIVEGDGSTTREGRGGSQAYSAPERNLATGSPSNFKPRVKQNIDTWSLACIFSEFHVWTIGGYGGRDYGVLTYRDARQTHKDVCTSFGACFHDRKGNLLATVEEWHTRSVSLCATQDHITPIIWKELLRRMFAPSEYRLQSKQVVMDCQEIIKQARDHLVPSRATEKPTPAVTWQGTSPPRTPPQIPREYRHQQSQAGVNSEPRFPSDGQRTVLRSSGDDDQSDRFTPSPNSLQPLGSPFSNRASGLSTPDYHHRSYLSVHTRTTSADTEKSGHKSPQSAAQRLSIERSPLSTSGSVAIRGEPTEATRSTVPAEVIAGYDSRPESNLQAQPLDIAGLPELPDSSTTKGKERVADERQSREPAASEPARYLSVDELMQWVAQTREASKQVFLRRKEIPLPFENELLGELKERDHVFLIDDSSSMGEHWHKLERLLNGMIYMVKKKKLDLNGSELRFVMSDQCKEAQNTTPLINMVKARREKLSGQSNLAHRLERIFQAYCKKLQRCPTSTKSISLYIFTDGKWQPGARQLEEVANAIKGLIDFLQKKGYPKTTAGIQLIRFGNDPVGMERLRWLDEDLPKEHGLTWDICDTTPANDNVWKMLLGSINGYWDDDK
ncbi:hypothetical protein CLCR_09508 [Cladophialophora carrionii]|uniref:Protein kinase domain-containing protein n=1 Tax=Cladophialophora carrionii TaxID=86049 RepID=A0A1C1CY46_9EURO|nr:hypothetical protein CLCR_09508 [Cladophialophora carrionii]